MAAVADRNKRALILEYENILIGQKKQFSSYYLSGNRLRDSGIAIELLKYFFRDILCWDAKTIEKNLLEKKQVIPFLKKYKLDKYVNNFIYFDNEPNGKPRYINKELDESDAKQLIKMIYSDYKIDLRTSVVTTYEDVIEGRKAKFPKHFFDVTANGKTKACICLQRAISSHGTFSSVEELYNIFGDKNILKLLAKWRLKDVAQQYFDYPIDYLHASLPNELKDECFYKMYRKKYIKDIKPSGRVF